MFWPNIRAIWEVASLLIFYFVDLAKLSALLLTEETLWILSSIGPFTGHKPSWWPSLAHRYPILSWVLSALQFYPWWVLCLITLLLFPLSSLRPFGLFLCVMRRVVVGLVIVCICCSCGFVFIWMWYQGHSLLVSWGRIELRSLWPLIFLLLGTLLVGCGICLACIPLTRHGESSGELLGGRVGPIVLVWLASLW